MCKKMNLIEEEGVEWRKCRDQWQLLLQWIHEQQHVPLRVWSFPELSLSPPFLLNPKHKLNKVLNWITQTECQEFTFYEFKHQDVIVTLLQKCESDRSKGHLHNWDLNQTKDRNFIIYNQKGKCESHTKAAQIEQKLKMWKTKVKTRSIFLAHAIILEH